MEMTRCGNQHRVDLSFGGCWLGTDELHMLGTCGVQLLVQFGTSAPDRPTVSLRCKVWFQIDYEQGWV